MILVLNLWILVEEQVSGNTDMVIWKIQSITLILPETNGSFAIELYTHTYVYLYVS